jgi:hypothetical protein
MRTRPGRLILFVTAAATVLALTAAPAGAATKLKFFEKSESVSLTDSAGRPIADPNAAPAAGDTLEVTNRDFVGNHKHHAKRFTVTDHLRCTFTSASEAVCNGQFAIGGSMLLAENATVKLDFTTPTVVVPITGGTGVYEHAKGTVTSNNIGNTGNADVTISLHR